MKLKFICGKKKNKYLFGEVLRCLKIQILIKGLFPFIFQFNLKLKNHNLFYFKLN